jgi:transposase
VVNSTDVFAYVFATSLKGGLTVADVIMIGCDLHDRTMLLKVAQGRNQPDQRTFGNTAGGRRVMLRWLKGYTEAAGVARVVFAYEASCLGFGLYDEVTEAGFECHVLAPTRIERSPKHRRSKTDERDAKRLLDLVRAHVLAGTDLPAVWIPDRQTREDREVVRARLNLREKATRVKAQIQMLLKRHPCRRPDEAVRRWSRLYRAWLRGLVREGGPLPPGARAMLGSLMRQLTFLEEEIARLEEAVSRLSTQPRYAEAVRALCCFKGVRGLTAMVFLTELGDLSRFENRRQVAAYLGLVPSSHESGEAVQRKGHITHQGSARVRKVLCQAVWSCLRCDETAQEAHARIAAGKKNRRKIATVALMRRMAIRLWHIGLAAQRRAGSFAAPPASEAA